MLDDTIKEFPNLFPSFSRLAVLTIVILVLSERGFSVQNRIKTKGRSRLSDKWDKHNDCLMLLAMHEANVEDFDNDAIQEFVPAKGWIAWIVNLSHCYILKREYFRIHLHWWSTCVLKANVFGLLSNWQLFWNCYKTCGRPSRMSTIGDHSS